MMFDFSPIKVIVVPAVLLFCVAATAAGKDAVIEIGTTITIDSKLLERKADLTVHLPDDYDSGEGGYPVFFMLGSEWRTRFAMWASYLDYMSGGGQVEQQHEQQGGDVWSGGPHLLPSSGNDLID